jgi:hypothetical protein
MATMLKVCTTKEQHYVVYFLLAKGFSAKDIHKEMFPVHNWSADISLMMKRFERRRGSA